MKALLAAALLAASLAVSGAVATDTTCAPHSGICVNPSNY